MDVWEWVKILVSPVVTFIAFFFTYKTNKKQNLEIRKGSEEQQRISLLPLLSICESSIKKENRTVYIDVNDNKSEGNRRAYKIVSTQNLGQATAVNAEILFIFKSKEPEYFKIGHIGVNETINLYMSFLYTEESFHQEIYFIFHDLKGNKYSQHINMQYEYDNGTMFTFDVPSYPERS